MLFVSLMMKNIPANSHMNPPGRIFRIIPWPLIFIGVGAGLRFWQIGSQPLWLDEAFSLWLARQPWPDMIAWIVRIDQHPPLYYTLLHGWMVWGDGEFVVRFLSAWAGILTLPLIYVLGRRMGGNQVGLMTLLLLAVSPFHIHLAQEARMYTWLTLNASAAMLALTRILGEPQAEIGGLGRPRINLAWPVYVGFTAAAMLTHNTAVLLPVAINVAAVGLCRRRTRRWWIGWLLAQAGVLLLWSPWLRAFVTQCRGVYGEFWIPAPDVGRVAGALKNMLSAFLPDDMGWGHAIWVGYAALLVGGLLHLRRERRPSAAGLLLGLWLIPWAAELLISIRRPIFYDRTLLWTSLPLYVLLAGGLCRLRRAPLIGLAAAGLVMVNGISLGEYYTHYRKEQWHLAAAWVAERARPDDLILFNATWVQIPFDYYFERLQGDGTQSGPERRGVPVDLFERGILEPKMVAADLPRLHALIAGREQVFLVYSHNWYTDPQRLIPAAIKPGYRLAERHPWVGLEVYWYVR